MKFSDLFTLFPPRIIAILALSAAGAVVLAITLGRVGNALNRYSTGWKALTQRFPATDVHKIGGRYKSQRGFFGSKSNNNNARVMLLVELAQEGFLVTPHFDKTSILIPWSAITNILEVDMFGMGTYTQIVVDYEKRVKFTVPKEALIAIQENVPAERLHKAAFSELLKNCLLNKPSN
jgi:hypothetical protein